MHRLSSQEPIKRQQTRTLETTTTKANWPHCSTLPSQSAVRLASTLYHYNPIDAWRSPEPRLPAIIVLDMPPKDPFRYVYCLLVPAQGNAEAQEIVDDLSRENPRLVSSGGVVITHEVDPKRAGRLLTFGRGKHNAVVLRRPFYSYNQCEIFVHPETAEILIRDMSEPNYSTCIEVGGDIEAKYDWEATPPRQRRLPPFREVTLCMGDAEFRMAW